MTEPPHPHFPSSTSGPAGPNSFHPHPSYPSGPWVHQHHYGYNTHWRAYRCGRTKGRLLFFALGAGAAAFYFREKKQHGGGDAYGYPSTGSNAVAGGAAASAYDTRQRSSCDHPHHHHWGWGWGNRSDAEREGRWGGRAASGHDDLGPSARAELEPRRILPAAPTAPTAVLPAAVAVDHRPVPPPQQTTAVSDEDGQATNKYGWGYWANQDSVRGATGAVVDLTESGLDSLISTINGLKLKLKAAEARAFEAEEQAKINSEAAEKKAKEERERKLV